MCKNEGGGSRAVYTMCKKTSNLAEDGFPKVTMKSLEETVKEQGGEEFLAMVKEVNKGKMDVDGGKLPVASSTDQTFAPFEDLLVPTNLCLGGPIVQAAGEHDGVCADQRGRGGVPQEPHGVQHPRA